MLAFPASAAANWHAECLFVSPTGASPLSLALSLTRQQKAILLLPTRLLAIWQLSSEWEAACTLTPGNYCARLMNSIIRLRVSVSLAAFVWRERVRRGVEASETGRSRGGWGEGEMRGKRQSEVSLPHRDKKNTISRLKKVRRFQVFK